MLLCFSEKEVHVLYSVEIIIHGIVCFFPVFFMHYLNHETILMYCLWKIGCAVFLEINFVSLPHSYREFPALKRQDHPARLSLLSLREMPDPRIHPSRIISPTTSIGNVIIWENLLVSVAFRMKHKHSVLLRESSFFSAIFALVINWREPGQRWDLYVCHIWSTLSVIRDFLRA